MGKTFDGVGMNGPAFVREYLDPNDTLSACEVTESDAAEMWGQLEEVFEADGGTGMSRLAFVNAVGTIQMQAGYTGW